LVDKYIEYTAYALNKHAYITYIYRPYREHPHSHPHHKQTNTHTHNQTHTVFTYGEEKLNASNVW